MSTATQATAALAFSLLDLTSLTDNETIADIEQLAENASLTTANGERLQVAALCVYPRFIPYARKALDQRGLERVRIATVSNFPHGGDDIDIAVAETKACVAYGADEVDVVFPYHAFLAGDKQTASLLIKACKAACGTHALLKVILETGELATPQAIAEASELALAAGADFIKTSTGKATVNATPEAAHLMLQAIAAYDQRPAGFKPAGGIKNLTDATVYIEKVRALLGEEAVSPARFRIGASSVRTDLAQVLGETRTSTQPQGGY